MTCCNIASSVFIDVILPIKRVLGIDEFKTEKSDKRPWNSMKEEFQRILKMLNERSKSNNSDGHTCLSSKEAASVHEALQR